MGWDWEASKKGDIIRFWFFDESGDNVIGDQVKFNYNLKTKKISNCRIYRIDNRTEKIYEKTNEKGHDKFIKMYRAKMWKKKPGYRDAMKYLKGTPPNTVNKFVNNAGFFRKNPKYNKIFDVDGVKCKYIKWGLTNSQIKSFTKKDYK
jgi:hypothetical protein